MSNALAIAHVTQALALLIESNIGPEIDMAVKVEPRKPPADPPTDQPTISVFLYQVTPNTSQRNNDLPTRAADGTLVKRPAAALDLHYLISAYGDETELVGQRLIGSV
ncbi:Pvc16 family protein, partial [Streptomyces sp. KR55]